MTVAPRSGTGDLRQGASGGLTFSPESQPSAFWKGLADEHLDDLVAHGFESIKRRQALRYFTWRWRPGAVRGSEQLRYLLRHTSPLTWLRCAVAPMDLRASSWRPLDWSLAERWLYTVAVRLLWQVADRDGSDAAIRLGEPMLGDPLPVRWEGALISQDLANAALEAHAILRLLGGREPGSILEIGAGYGRTAYVLLSLFPRCRYTIIDIEPALALSKWYPRRLFPDRDLTFAHPDEKGIEPADLSLSISSLQEMTRQQVANYLALMDRVTSGHVYLKQWASWYNPRDGQWSRFDAYPVPPSWRPVFREPAPVQSGFRQAGWEVRGLR